MTQQITITRPDDWHLHVRDGAALHTVVPHTAAQFGRVDKQNISGLIQFKDFITVPRYQLRSGSPG